MHIPAKGKPTLIVFTHPSCATYYELMPELNEFYTLHRSMMAVVVVCPAGLSDVKRFGEEAKPAPPLIADAGLIAASYNVNVSPTAVFVDTAGMIVRTTQSPSSTVPALLGWLQTSGA